MHSSADAASGLRSGGPWLLFLGLLVINLVGTRPACNWDIIGYVAAMYALDGNSDEGIHARTYQAVRESCSEQYALLTESNGYRQAIASSAQALAEQLPFYAVKPAYPLLMSVLNNSGMHPVAASVAISKGAYAGVGIVALLWLRTFITPLSAVLGAWLLLSLSFVLDLARLSTPDALSTLVVVAGLYLLFVRSHSATCLTLLALAVAIRPDNLLWLWVVAGYVALKQPRQPKLAAAASAVGLALYIGISAWSGSYGWPVHFYHQFVGRLIQPATFQPTLGLWDYIRIYLRETHPANQPWFLLPIVLVGGWAAVMRSRSAPASDSWLQLLAVTASYMLLRWFIYPEEDRLFVGAYLAILLTAARTAVDLARQPTSQLAPTNSELR